MRVGDIALVHGDLYYVLGLNPTSDHIVTVGLTGKNTLMRYMISGEMERSGSFCYVLYDSAQKLYIKTIINKLYKFGNYDY